MLQAEYAIQSGQMNSKLKHVDPKDQHISQAVVLTQDDQDEIKREHNEQVNLDAVKKFDSAKLKKAGTGGGVASNMMKTQVGITLYDQKNLHSTQTSGGVGSAMLQSQ